MFNLKHIFLVCVLFSIFSCQSNLQIVGGKHKTSMDKWHELANFSESNLNSFKVKLVASFSLNSESSNVYQLSNFRISITEDYFDINLLQPSIKQKYLCDPICKQLSELTVSRNEGAAVLSDFYFDQSEFDLFKFYGDLYLLNKNIIHFNKYNPELVNNYLLFLVKQNHTFSDINDFMIYLKKALNPDSFYIFVNEPSNRFKALNFEPLEANGWNQRSSVDLPEITTQAPMESLHWSNEEISHWSDEEILTEIVLWNDNQSTDEGSKNNNKLKNTDENPTSNNIFIGDIVCHGPSNLFGLVQAIRGKDITVQIVGELRVYDDGILIVPKPNEILLKSGKIDFVRLNKQQQYSIDKIEKCNLFNAE